MKNQGELVVIQLTYDLVKWYVPILNRLPRDHKYGLGERIVSGLYELLEGLLRARYSKAHERYEYLRKLNSSLEVLRYQTRLLHEFKLIGVDRYEYAFRAFNAIGVKLGAWIKNDNRRNETPG